MRRNTDYRLSFSDHKSWLLRSWKYLALSFITFTLIGLAWWQGVVAYEDNLLDQKRSSLQLRANGIGNALTSTINQRQVLLHGLAAFVKTHPLNELRNHYFDVYAAGLQANDPVIRSIQYAPAQGTVLVYPLEGNEAIINRSLNHLRNDERPNVREDVQRAIETRKITLSDPYDLRQGGQGVVARLAVYDEEQFFGLVVVVLNLDPMLEITGLAPLPTDFRFGIKNADQQVFFGDEQVFSSNPVRTQVELPEGSWTLAIAPVSSWAAEIAPQRIVNWLAGLPLALLAAAITYFIASRQSSLAQQVQIQSEALTQREEQLRLAVAASGVGFFDWDLRTNQVHYSPEWKRQIGYEVDEIQDDFQEWAGRIHPDDLERVLNSLHESIQSHAPGYETEFRLQHKNGAYRWILTRGSFHKNAAGEPDRMLGCHIDVTQQKQNELDLSASEHRFRGLAENSSDYIMLYDRECRHVYANPATLYVSGMTEADMLGKTHRESGFDEELSEMWEVDIRQVFATGKASQRLFAWESAHGEVFLDWRLSPIFDEDGQVDLVLGVSRDITSIKQAEEKLQTSERTLKLFVEHAPAAIAMFDNDMCYIAASRRFLLDYRLADHNVVGRSHYEIFPEIPQRWKDIHQRCLAGGIEKAEDDPFPRADGTLDWIRWEIRPWFEQSGAIGGILLFSEVITERKHSQEQITQLVERLDLATRSAHLGVWDWDIVHNKLLWDERMDDLYGIQKGSFTGGYEVWFNSVHLEDRARTDEALQQALRGEKDFDIEFRVVLPNGAMRWIKADGYVVRALDGIPQRMIGINYDVTERRQAEEVLRQRNSFIETILENSPIGFAVNRISDGLATFVSSKFNAIYGLQRGSLISVDDYFEKVYLDPVFREQFRARVLTDIASGDAARMRWENIPITTRSGEQKVITALNIPLIEQDLMISTVQDVTERWRAEAEIRKLNAELEGRVLERTAQLEAANREMEAFSYSVSHDLRAPLRGIDGWSLALFEDYHEQLDEKGRQYIHRVRGETQRMGHLIDDLLRLSRLSRQEMQQSVVNLSELAYAIVARLQETHPDRQIEWMIKPDMVASGDAHLLEIVLTNLLANAHKFTGKQPQARIEFGQMDGKTAYYIRDNGVGFNMANAKNLFGAFQRMHKQSDFPGTGVGLATAQRIIRRHGGSIWAEAEKNAGATFYFTLEEAA